MMSLHAYELKRARDNRRSARLRQARSLGTHTEEEWQTIIAANDGRCMGCGIAAAELVGGILTKDHVTPISAGGSDAASNLQPLCRQCNTAKHQAEGRQS